MGDRPTIETFLVIELLEDEGRKDEVHYGKRQFVPLTGTESET